MSNRSGDLIVAPENPINNHLKFHERLALWIRDEMTIGQELSSSEIVAKMGKSSGKRGASVDRIPNFLRRCPYVEMVRVVHGVKWKRVPEVLVK